MSLTQKDLEQIEAIFTRRIEATLTERIEAIFAERLDPVLGELKALREDIKENL